MNEFKEIRNAAGWSQARVSRELEIPLRTIENWESGSRACPDYVKKLVVEELKRKIEEGT